MSKDVINILLIEDDEDDYILTRSYLTDNERFDFNIDWEHDYGKGLERVKENAHDLYLIDYRLGSLSGIDLLKEAREAGIAKPMIMLTGQDSYQTDIESMASGASDYLVKGEINNSLLERAIRYNLEQYHNIMTLREQEVKYRVLFEESLDAVFIANDDLEILDSNFAFRKLLGVFHDSDEMLELSGLFKDEACYQKFKDEFDQNSYIINREINLKDADGNEKLCLISVNRTESQNDAPAMIQGIIKDITLLKKAEKELIDSEKAILTGKMVRTVAHEIRNPLTNIMLSLKQLEKKINDSGEDTKNFIEIAGKNTLVINTLIDEMLQASSPGEMSFKSTSLNDIIEESVKFCKDRIELQHVELVMDLDKTVDCRELDPEQLKRAFNNVIINAVEAMSKSDKKILTITSKMTDGDCTITISDTGEGIEEDKIKDLFEPFFTGKAGGMGLGLTLVMNVMKKHRAEVKVSSKLGEGTKFEFIFPI